MIHTCKYRPCPHSLSLEKHLSSLLSVVLVFLPVLRCFLGFACVKQANPDFHAKANRCSEQFHVEIRKQDTEREKLVCKHVGVNSNRSIMPHRRGLRTAGSTCMSDFHIAVNMVKLTVA